MNALRTLNPEKWVEHYADYLYNYAIVRVNDHIVAQEVVAETFLSGLRGKKNFKGKSSERTWLISILKRKIIDYYRQQQSAKGKAEVSISHQDPEEAGAWLERKAVDLASKSIEDLIENEELRLVILDCMEQLPEKQREIFKMKTIEGLETEIICKKLNISPSNLWVSIHRARKAMMECLERNWFNN